MDDEYELAIAKEAKEQAQRPRTTLYGVSVIQWNPGRLMQTHTLCVLLTEELAEGLMAMGWTVKRLFDKTPFLYVHGRARSFEPGVKQDNQTVEVTGFNWSFETKWGGPRRGRKTFLASINPGKQ